MNVKHKHGRQVQGEVYKSGLRIGLKGNFQVFKGQKWKDVEGIYLTNYSFNGVILIRRTKNVRRRVFIPSPFTNETCGSNFRPHQRSLIPIEFPLGDSEEKVRKKTKQNKT